MAHRIFSPRALSDLGARPGESEVDYRERLIQDHALAQERWAQKLREQTSPDNDAAARIRIWERRHQIDLPRNPAHRLIALIAAGTDLTVHEVLEEQRARAAARPPTAAKSE